MGVRSRDNQNFSDRSGAYAPGSVDYHILLGMGLRLRARSSANNPYVRHHKVSPENFHRNFRTSDKRSLSHMENRNNYRV